MLLPNPSELTITLETGATTALVYRNERDARATLILGHGAGAGQRSAFMVDFAHALSALGVDIVTFNFLYTEQGRKIPDRAPVLEACYRAVIAAARANIDSARRALFIGGKSMGGRVASLVADALHEQGLIAGCVGLGYPFHPPKSAQTLRVAHLATLRCPTLIIQGTRDALGNRAEVMGYDLSASIKLHWLDDGDHDFKPRKASGHTQDGHIKAAAAAMAAFAASTV